jgi:hypothetical protein
MNITKIAFAGALAISTLLGADNAAAAAPYPTATAATSAKVAPSPESVEFFRQLWDNAMLFAYRGYGNFAQSTCDIYRSQVWPDPGANEVVPLVHLQCRISVVNIYIHHTNPLPFPL